MKTRVMRQFNIVLGKAFILLAVLFFCIGNSTAKGRVIVIDSILNKAVHKSYGSYFEKLKKEHKADGTIVSAFFPDSVLKLHTEEVLKEYLEKYYENLDKHRDNESLSIFIANRYSKLLKKKVKKSDKELVKNAQESLKLAFAKITDYSLFEYLRCLKEDVVDWREAYADVNKKLQDKEGECEKQEEALRKKLNAEKSKIQKDSDLKIKKLEEENRKQQESANLKLKNELNAQESKFSDAKTVKEKRDKNIEKINTAKTDYLFKDIMTDVSKDILINELYVLYAKAYDFYSSKNEYALTNEQVTSLEDKLYKIKDAIEFYLFVDNINQILNNKVKDILPQNQKLYNESNYREYTLTEQQKLELLSLKEQLVYYKRCKSAFNNLLITLDGKDALGRSKNLDKGAVEGRMKDERIVVQKSFIDSFKTIYPRWAEFPAIKERMEKVERNDANASFAQFTL